jgi:hypothetical protein
MKTVSLEDTEYGQEGTKGHIPTGDNTVRSLYWYDVFLVLLLPVGFIGFATVSRVVTWTASIIALLPFMAIYSMPYLEVFQVFNDSFVSFSVIMIGCHFILVMMALVLWVRGRNSALERCSLPRQVIWSDNVLLLFCPPAVISIHRTARRHWILPIILWYTGHNSAASLWSGSFEGNGWQVIRRVLVTQGATMVMAVISNISADRLYSSICQ